MEIDWLRGMVWILMLVLGGLFYYGIYKLIWG